MKTIASLLEYFSEVKKEFKHIRFLKKKDLSQIFIMVIISVILFSFSFSLLDLAVTFILKRIIGF